MEKKNIFQRVGIGKLAVNEKEVQKCKENDRCLLPITLKAKKKQIVGVSGGVIAPTEIDVELFRSVGSFRKVNFGKEEGLVKKNLLRINYNDAWRYVINTQNNTEKYEKDFVKDGR